MANTYRLVHAFQGSGGTSLDTYVNQFYFFTTTHAPADADTWGPSLAASVHGLWAQGGAGNSIASYYHKRCKGNLGTTKIYDVTGNPAFEGAPIFVIADSTLVSTSDYVADAPDDAAGMPEEVAICLSYQAIHTDGNLPRRRGRIYLGPWNVLALNDTDGSGSRSPTEVNGALQERIVINAVTMQSSAAAIDFEWRVFSKMDGFAFKIVTFSCDNAFDTIRGRGRAPSYRYELPIT